MARARIGIVGTGWVGASVAISVLHRGIAGELLLCDRRGELAEGEAMDLAHGASFYPAARVRAASAKRCAAIPASSSWWPIPWTCSCRWCAKARACRPSASSARAPCSSAQAGGRPLRAWPQWRAQSEARLAEEVRNAAYEIIRRKGATNHAIGLVTATLLGWMLGAERRIVTVSRVQTGAAGLSEVALSLPAIVGAGGATEVVLPQMDAAESEALARSAEVIRRACQDARG